MKTELRKIRGMQSLRSGGQGILGDSWWRAGLALQARGAQMSSINETTALVLCARSGGGNRGWKRIKDYWNDGMGYI